MKTTKWIAAIALLLSLTSCTFKENIYINDDGSGKFALDMDGSSIMAMVPKDSLGKGEKAIDTSFAFKDLFLAKKDSIAKLSKEEQARLKKLEKFAMRMNVNTDQKQLLLSVTTDFKNVAELQDAMGAMSEMKNLEKGKKAENPLGNGDAFGKNYSTLKYTYDGKKFTRNATIDKKQKALAAKDTSGAAYKMIYEQSTYSINYHFPKKVKKVSNTAALYSEDRKTITIEYPFMDYVENPEKLNFQVEFE